MEEKRIKTILTVEESQRLIELGVGPKLASESVGSTAIGNGVRGITKLPSPQPIFNIADILSILPKEIGSNDKIFSLNTEWRVHGDFADKHQWAVFYCDGFMVAGNHYAPELIDALYSLLIWLLEQKILVQ